MGNYFSSEQRDICAFYVKRNMTERAQKLDGEAIKAAPNDLDYFFKQVNDNPSHYRRE